MHVVLINTYDLGRQPFGVASPAAWLLPCMAFTASALALGEVLGLRWAALVLGLAWTAGVIAPVTVHAVTAPDMLAGQIPWLLRPASVPYWTGLVIAIAFALLARRDAYTGMRRQRWFVR